jgi:muramoyltetrapeptide carboxypeptidase
VKRPPVPRPGDRIAIVAPSSPFDEERYHRGAAWLGERYTLVVRDDVHARQGYLAGDDARRKRELDDALGDPSIVAVVAARGGYGATRFCATVDWSRLTEHPKWIVGFSDITALHVEAARAGVMSLHAPMLAWLGDADASARAEWLASFERGDYGSWDDLDVIVPGDAEGTSFGGNLALLEACAASGRLRVPDDAIVFLEDCTERPYRIDRMLTALLGHLRNVRGVVLGEWTDCAAGPDGVTTDQVLAERLRTLGVPLVACAPFGHGRVNRAFPIGARCRIAHGRVQFL